MKTRLRSASGQTVYNKLRAEILNLKMQPGQEIDELGLAARFKVSRTPVREVILRLAAEDLVELRPNRGARVALMNFDELPAMMDSLEILQRLTARGAAQWRTDDDLVELRALSAQFDENVAANDILRIVSSNWRFHDAINRASGNRFLADDAARALTRMLRVSTLVFQRAGVGPDAGEQHQEMIAAIEERDAAKADQLIVEHITILRRVVAAYLSESKVASTDLASISL